MRLPTLAMLRYNAGLNRRDDEAARVRLRGLQRQADNEALVKQQKRWSGSRLPAAEP